MPGLPMEEDSTPSHPFVKAEDDDFDLDYDGVDESDEGEGAPVYRPRPQLNQPTVLMRSLAYLMKALDTGVIDVNPEYQREVVWPADRMTGLINSLMENYYIPPIILNKKERPAGLDGQRNAAHTMVCVDGKQRLSSVQAFVQGLIPCHDHRGDKWWFCNTSGRARNVLPEATQKAFLAKEFVSFEFTNLSPDQEEDLFARVQMGVQLTAAEKMRATTGPWQELAKVFVEDFPHVFSLLKDRTRARDFQMALACFSQILEVQHPTNPNGFPGWKTNVKIVEKFILNQAALDDGTRSHLAAVFRKFNDLILLEPELFKNTGKKLKGVQSFAPIEMVTIAVMISMYGDERNDRLLLGDIRYMRNLLRENYIDLRMNLPMWRFIWDFIDKLEQVRGAVDGSTVNKQKQLKPPSTSTGATPAKKRGRPRIEDEPPITATASGTAKRRPDAVEPPQQKRSRVMPQPAVVKQEPADPTELPPFPPFPTSPVGSNTYQSPTATSSARPFDPRQARLNRIAELNSYRAPVASMSSTAPPATVPMTTYAPQAFTAPITLPYQRTPSQRVTPVQPAPPGFAVYLNDRITDNIQRQNRTAEPIKSEYPRSSATYTTSLRDRPAPREPDDAIDLTSDTEIESERQNLLSSFRSQATNGKATAQLHAQGTPRRKASSSNDSRRSAARDSKIQPVVLDDY